MSAKVAAILEKLTIEEKAALLEVLLEEEREDVPWPSRVAEDEHRAGDE